MPGSQTLPTAECRARMAAIAGARPKVPQQACGAARCHRTSTPTRPAGASTLGLVRLKWLSVSVHDYVDSAQVGLKGAYGSLRMLREVRGRGHRIDLTMASD